MSWRILAKTSYFSRRWLFERRIDINASFYFQATEKLATRSILLRNLTKNKRALSMKKKNIIFHTPIESFQFYSKGFTVPVQNVSAMELLISTLKGINAQIIFFLLTYGKVQLRTASLLLLFFVDLVAKRFVKNAGIFLSPFTIFCPAAAMVVWNVSFRLFFSCANVTVAYCEETYVTNRSN